MRRMTLLIRRIPWTLLSILMAFILLEGMTANHSRAQAADSFKVAVVDPQAVIEKSQAGSRALALLQEHQKARENVLRSDQRELQRLQDELKEAEGTVPEAVLKEKQEAFGRKYQEFQKRGQEFQVELTQKQRELVQEFMKKIEDVTSVVAKRHGFSLVVDKGSDNTLKIVLFSRDGLDITGEVVKEFDRRYK